MMCDLISSYALLTPFGDAERTWASLVDGRCLRDSDRVPLTTGGPYPRVTSLALNAAIAALRAGGLAASELDASTGLIVATSKGEIDAWFSAQPGREVHGGAAVTFPLGATGLAEIAGTIARELRLGGPCLTVSAACASGLLALVRGVLMLRGGEARRVLVVAAESSFHPILIASYRRLGVLADAATGCRPFDRERGGFLVGEAAAAVVLERSSDPQGIRIDGFSMGSDAVSITATDPSGRTLSNVVRRAVGGGTLDLIHAHGTGTLLNDPIELAAIDAALSEMREVPLYSHKAALGHTLGASGLVSVVINCIAHRSGMAPPNARTVRPLHSLAARISDVAVRARIRRSLAIAAGFGGPVCAVTLASHPPA